MKILLAITILVVAAAALFIFLHHGTRSQDSVVSSVTPVTAKKTDAHLNSQDSKTPPPLAWQEFRSARNATLASHPDLASEYKEIVAEIDTQQKKLEAAMVKADPQAGAAVAKLDVIRQFNSGKLHASASGEHGEPQAPPILSPQEWQELRYARAAALRQQPALVTQSEKLAVQMREFRSKMNDAMVKTDPKIASFLNAPPPGLRTAPAVQR